MSSIFCSSISGNSQWLDGGAMFGNAPRLVWEKWITPDSRNRIPLNCRSLFLEISNQKILCETGIGAFFEPKLAERYGVEGSNHMLLENLGHQGISHEEIDFVILSHLHFDHAGGLLSPWTPDSKELKLLFPNAKYIVGRTAFERALQPHPRDKASFIPKLQELLVESKRLILVEGSSHSEVLPESISFHFTHGHTPGHMHTIVKSDQNRQIVFAGDLIPGLAWVHLPITMGYDRFAELVIDEKKSFYDRFANDHTWIFYTHDHTFAASRVKWDENNRYIPENKLVALDHFEL